MGPFNQPPNTGWATMTILKAVPILCAPPVVLAADYDTIRDGGGEQSVAWDRSIAWLTKTFTSQHPSTNSRQDFSAIFVHIWRLIDVHILPGSWESSSWHTLAIEWINLQTLYQGGQGGYYRNEYPCVQVICSPLIVRTDWLPWRLSEP